MYCAGFILPLLIMAVFFTSTYHGSFRYSKLIWQLQISDVVTITCTVLAQRFEDQLQVLRRGLSAERIPAQKFSWNPARPARQSEYTRATGLYTSYSAHTDTHTHTRARTHTHAHAHAHAHTHAHTHARTHAHAHTHTRHECLSHPSHTHAHAHAHAHTCTRKHIHTHLYHVRSYASAALVQHARRAVTLR